MKTMNRKITDRLKGWLLLLMAAFLLPACSENGDETIVIEDGQPSVATLLIGRWRPERAERIHKTNENDRTEEPGWSGGPEWEFFEDGTFGRSDEPNRRFRWQADEEDYGVSIGDTDWRIRSLGKGRLILYRPDGDYWIVYYFGRIGAYPDDEGEGEGGDTGGSKVMKIVEKTTYADGRAGNIRTHAFEYDSEGRIGVYTIGSGKNTYTWGYAYENGQVSVQGEESYKAELNEKGYITGLWASYNGRPNEVVSSVTYDKDGYLASLRYPGGQSVSFRYSGKNLAAVDSYTYEYAEEKNGTNLDLNCLISNCSTVYEYGYSHYTLFAPFGFYGKPSENLVAREFLGPYTDFDYTYTYTSDSKGRISQIVRESVTKSPTMPPMVLHTTTFDIEYGANE